MPFKNKAQRAYLFSQNVDSWRSRYAVQKFETKAVDVEKQAKTREEVDERVREQTTEEEEKAPILGGWPIWNDEHTKIIGWHGVDGTEEFFDDMYDKEHTPQNV